ncbi:HD-GYP domain-containing protein [Dethiothermospora halolimnae]|uniref:HD-GYP domain-containing protein n=1 Tax=Dethiothermospora halolimnae TaxID=3114390 RepID=UPI003CCB7F81
MKEKMVILSGELIGEVLSRNIYDSKGTLVVSKNTTINERILYKMENFNIGSLYIYDKEEFENKDELNFKELKKEYKEGIRNIKDIIENLTAGKDMTEEEILGTFDFMDSRTYGNNLIIACVESLKDIDDYTYTHSVNVALYAMLIGKWLKLRQTDIKKIILAGLLHDIGKSKTPPHILNKRGRLSPHEFEEMKKHTIHGYNISKNVYNIDKNVQQAVLMHHERIDGCGYPLGVKGNQIGLYARIIAVADVYDALTSKRVYKDKMTPFKTFDEMIKMGYGHFDAKIMLTFFNNLTNYYLGSKVKMDSGEIGKVVYVYPYNTFKPVVKTERAIIDLLSKGKDDISEIICE